MEMTVFKSLILINKAILLAFGELQYEVEWLRSKPWWAALLHPAYIDRILTEMTPLLTLGVHMKSLADLTQVWWRYN